MLSVTHFRILEHIHTVGRCPQRELAAYAGVSLGTANAAVKALREQGMISADGGITPEAAAELAPYRVENAIILAAGMSTRFVPFSYEKPKGLTVVRGEVLIERQIRQLREAGVGEIVVVVGHMLEKFLYLAEKYGVTLVVNNDYRTKNNHSSIYAAREYLKNSYICCSDIYYPNNLFHGYELRSEYCVQYLDGESRTERGMITNGSDLVIATEKPTKNRWIMAGHAYFDRAFSEEFKSIIETYYGQPGTDAMYWETIYAEQLDRLPMYVRRCAAEDILEFDSVEDLRKYDPLYLSENTTPVIRNICTALDAAPEDIRKITPISGGLTNRSFRFECRGTQYVYRNPGNNTIGYIDRQREQTAMLAAKKLGLDKSFVFEDPKDGWKISLFVNETEHFDFSRPEHLSRLCAMLRTLHASGIRCGKRFDFFEEADRLIEKLRPLDISVVEDLLALREQILPLRQRIVSDGWPVQLSHNDIYEPNILISGDDFYLIDWEYAGDTDIGFDLCKLFAVPDAPPDTVRSTLSLYYERPVADAEYTHVIACAAVNYYYWYVWAVYMCRTGNDCASYQLGWYNKMRNYMQEAQRCIQKGQ